MQKPNSLRITLLISTLLCIIKLGLDIYLIMYSHSSAYTLVFGETISGLVLPTQVKLGLVLETFIFSAPICIVASVNFAYKDLKAKRGVITIILSIIMFLTDYAGSILANKIICRKIKEAYGENLLNVVSQLNSLKTFSGCFVCAAFVMVCCCASIEIYGARLYEQKGKE